MEALVGIIGVILVLYLLVSYPLIWIVPGLIILTIYLIDKGYKSWCRNEREQELQRKKKLEEMLTLVQQMSQETSDFEKVADAILKVGKDENSYKQLYIKSDTNRMNIMKKVVEDNRNILYIDENSVFTNPANYKKDVNYIEGQIQRAISRIEN